MRPLRHPAAFTLVELLVSMAVISLLAVLLAGMVNQASFLWIYTTGKVEEFRSAENAFEAVTTRLSQATLNTYWDYQRDANGNVLQYIRQSDLRFRVGAAPALLGTNPPKVGKCLFFNAPLGMVGEAPYASLENLLNCWGYYVEFNTDKNELPAFLSSMPSPPPERFRYRLMELMQPSEQLEMYQYTTGSAAAAGYGGTDWFTVPLTRNTPPPPVHLRSENVIAMILLPKLSFEDDPSGTTLSPNYEYDSSPLPPNSPPIQPGALDPQNQLPPLVQVTLVAMDEASALRIASQSGTKPPDFGVAGLFQSAVNFDQDIATLQQTLAARRVNFRIFTADVSIRGARWSRN